VKEMRIWTGGENNGFTAIYITMSNGNKYSVGNIPARGPDGAITFAPGETLVGTIELCGNGIGTRTGYMYFKTSKGQEFKVGEEHTPYYFESGNSFLLGFFGQAGSEIDQMGFYLMKPVKAAQLLNVNYPTLDSYMVGLTPQVYKASLCNDDNSTAQSQTATFTKTVGEKRIWSITASFSVTETLQVTAGVPAVSQVQDTFSWTVGVSASFSSEVDTTTEKSLSYPVIIPARTRMVGTFTWWDSECDVPFTASLVYTFADATTHTFYISDIFKGAYITDVVGGYHSVKLADGESC